MRMRNSAQSSSAQLSSAQSGSHRWDVVVVGGGHNALTAAAYLARAGRRVLVLERLGARRRRGGVGDGAFAGRRRAAVALLLPGQPAARSTIIDDLGLDMRLPGAASRPTRPTRRSGRGLLVDADDADATRRSFAAHRARRRDAGLDRALRRHRSVWRGALFPTLHRAAAHPRRTPSARWATTRCGPTLIERPLGASDRGALRRRPRARRRRDRRAHRHVRPPRRPVLGQNRCFLYHVIGNGTGDWDVPVGGMGAVTGALERAARDGGRRIVTGAEVTAIDARRARSRTPRRREQRVGRSGAGQRRAGRAGAACAGSEPGARRPRAPGEGEPAAAAAAPAARRRVPTRGGVRRHLPHQRVLRRSSSRAYAAARRGAVPDPLPCEIYCHSLTDPTILAPELAASGAPHADGVRPARPRRGCSPTDDDDALRARLRAASSPRSTSVLAEPIADLLVDRRRRAPCIETTHPRPRASPRHARRQHLPRRPRLAVRSTTVTPRAPPPGAGAWRPTTPASCSAAPVPCGAAGSAASAGTMPRWRC